MSAVSTDLSRRINASVRQFVLDAKTPLFYVPHLQQWLPFQDIYYFDPSTTVSERTTSVTQITPQILNDVVAFAIERGVPIVTESALPVCLDLQHGANESRCITPELVR